MKLNNLEIDFKSVFKKGVKKVVEPFGVFLITGPMGSGKTYFATRFSNDFKKTYTIKTNIKSNKKSKPHNYYRTSNRWKNRKEIT